MIDILTISKTFLRANLHRTQQKSMPREACLSQGCHIAPLTWSQILCTIYIAALPISHFVPLSHPLFNRAPLSISLQGVVSSKILQIPYLWPSFAFVEKRRKKRKRRMRTRPPDHRGGSFGNGFGDSHLDKKISPRKSP